MVEGLFSLLFYRASGINQCAAQKTLTYIFGARSVIIRAQLL